MSTTSPLKRLRQSSRMKAIPGTINVPALSDRTKRAVPIERATVDDMARRQGAFGADIAISAALRDLEAGQ